jgi:hypothetical protein
VDVKLDLRIQGEASPYVPSRNGVAATARLDVFAGISLVVSGWSCRLSLPGAAEPTLPTEMRLEPLCRLSMQYAEGAWARPFGSAEAAGFGWGEGSVSGEVIQGTLRWANSPRRREDGVWTPNLRGVVRTEDRAEILISMHGQSVQEETGGGARRAILARVELLSDHDGYRWLNTSFLVGEGEIDEETEEWWLDAHVCVNELVEHPPAIGRAPPERFSPSEPR